MAIDSCLLVTGVDTVSDAWVRFEGGKVATRFRGARQWRMPPAAF